MTIVRVRFTPNGVATAGRIRFQARHDKDTRPIVSGRDILNGNPEWVEVPVEGAEIEVRPQDAGWHYVVRAQADGGPMLSTTVLIPQNGPVNFEDLVRYDPKAGMAYEPDPDWWAHLAGVEVGFGAVQTELNAAVETVQSALVGVIPSDGFVLATDPDGCFVIVAEPAPPPEPLGPPTLISLEGNKGGAVATWMPPETLDPLAPITDYTVRYRLSGGNWTIHANSTSTSTVREITGLTNGAAYEFQVRAVNLAGGGQWSNTLLVTPGEVNGTVFVDPASRTAAELVGSSPHFGPEAWTGTAGNFSVTDGYIAGKEGAAGNLQSVGIGASGLVRWEGVINVDTMPAAATIQTRLYVKLGAGPSDSAYLRINILATGETQFAFICTANGATISNTFGMPPGTIPAGLSAADYQILIEQASATTYQVTINGVVRTVTLASDPGPAFANASNIGITTSSARVKHKITDVSVDGYYN